jgi:hypothetical protein
VHGLACAVTVFACAPRSSQPATGDGPRDRAAVTSAGAQIGKPAPPFTRRSLTGSTVTVPTKQEATVIVFFATWSQPDMILVTHLQHISAMHPELAVVAVSINDEGGDVLDATNARGARYPIVWDAEHVLASTYRIALDPTTLVLDKDGIVRFVHGGFRDGEQYAIDDEVSSLLKTDVCRRPLLTNNGPLCFHQCERMADDEAKCTTADCKARCSSSSRACRETCTRDNESRNAALAVCRRERPTTREACEAACHTEEMNNAMSTCDFQAAGQRALLDECAAVCGVGACRERCRRLKR